MRYPVNRFKEDWNLTAGYRFGAKTSYGFHEGDDLNKNGGGDIELGEHISQIAKGEMFYWHKDKHPDTGFGYHSVSKIVGPWGIRWVHNAHMLEDFVTTGVVEEGQQIGKVGKSGISRTGVKYAHDHFSIFKVDPITLRNGIDTIAMNEQELNAWWENPIAFIEKWMNPNVISEPMATISQKELDEIRKIRDTHYNDLQKANETIKNLNQIINDKNRVISDLQGEVSSLTTTIANNEDRINSLIEQAKKVIELEKIIRQQESDRVAYLAENETLRKSIAQLKRPKTFLEKLQFLFGG